MSKDTLTASIIGFSLGLIAAIAIWVVPRILPKNITKPTPDNITQASASPTLSTSLSLDITSNKDGDIVKTKTLKLAGKTTNTIFVVVTTPTENQVVQPNGNGDFEVDLTLSLGGNQIAVSAVDYNNQDITKNLNVYYYEEKI